ncbi:MAG: CarD family transcriptional regulator [Oscillospiraceae bacterium]|nr:CarD family transcriptional regulator [Oscillospiraceae bacterium]MBR3962608.1 CarD family transcriptional regulator [Oscillospiraceae bacterium]
MLEKGHVFVYGASGVCRVDDIRICDYGAGKKEYYILQPVFDLRSSLSVPVDSPAFSGHARELLSKDEVFKIIDSLPDSEAEWIKDDRERIETFRSLLEGGCGRDIAILIRSLYLHKKELAERGKKLRSSDETIMQRAEKLLYGEFAFVLGIEPKEVIPFIKNRVEK